MKLSEFKKTLEIEHNITVQYKTFAEILGYTKQYISEIKNKELSSTNLTKLQNHFTKVTRDASDNFSNISMYGEIEASLGNGIEVFENAPREIIQLPIALIKNIDANPTTSCIINTCGESMYPTIIGGSDKLLIDLSKRDIYDGKIYLIRFDNTIFVKRLQKLPNNQLKIISDNKEYESYTVDLNDNSINFDIIGRVLWISRKL